MLFNTYPHNLLQDFKDNAIEMSVLQTALSTLGKWRANGEGDHDIIWVLLSAITPCQPFMIRG